MSEARSGGATVLVVEDDPDGLDLVADALRLGGHDVMTALSADEALELLRAGAHPDSRTARLPTRAHDGEGLPRSAGAGRGTVAEPRRARVGDSISGPMELERLEFLGVVDALRKPFTSERLLQLVDEHRRARPTTGRFRGLLEGGDPAGRPPSLGAIVDEVSDLLAQSVDVEASVRDALDVIVPTLGDFAVIDVVPTESGELLETLALRHRDGEKQRIVEMATQRSRGRGFLTRMNDVLRAGEPVLRQGLDAAELERLAPDEATLLDLRALDLRAIVIAPLLVRRRVLGTLTLGSSDPSRRYDLPTLDAITDVAHRIGWAVDNGRLFHHVRRAVRAREDLLAAVSHDLRTPLSAIGLAAEALLSAGPVTGHPASRRCCEKILRNARQMEHLIRDLLDFSRLENGRLRVERAPQPILEIVRYALDAVAPRASGRVLSLNASPKLDGQILACDRGRVLQILDNLLSNAVRFTADDGHIAVRVTPAPGAVRIAVEDDGAGIAAEDVPYIFEPYRQGRRARAEQGGIGLGLYIAKGIAEAHGGTVGLEDRSGPGSTFLVTLPVGEPDEPASEARRDEGSRPPRV